MSWSMDRHGIRTLFDRGSKRLKQFELSGPRRERVSIGTYANELAAREAEFRQEAFGAAGRIDIVEMIDQRYGADYRYVKVKGSDGGSHVFISHFPGCVPPNDFGQ
jgi:hypothetical protein